MKTVLHAFAALTLALTLSACGGSGNEKSNSQPAAPVHTPGAHVDAEDYVGPPQTVVSKRVDPEVKKKTTENTTCKTRYTTGSKKGKCKVWNTKTVEKVTDDTDHVLLLPDRTEVDVDERTYDSYNLDDADKAADVFPRS
jgi:hypothetical protein